LETAALPIELLAYLIVTNLINLGESIHGASPNSALLRYASCCACKSGQIILICRSRTANAHWTFVSLTHGLVFMFTKAMLNGFCSPTATNTHPIELLAYLIVTKKSI
jgi:hypothetical protein